MTTGLWLITSGAYVSQELAAEFGQLPPSFLPVGTRRLYEYQVERIGKEHPIFLTIPESYAVLDVDKERLASAGVTCVAVPDELALGESIVFALNMIGGPDQPIWILHGDTLVDPLPQRDLDSLGIAESGGGYSWARVSLDGDIVRGLHTMPAGLADEHDECVACGYFAFSQSIDLVRSLTRARGNFVDGILDYCKTHRLHAIRVAAWFDFGHVQTFFRSRRLVTSARHFNVLHIDGRTARKTSSDVEKMRAEAAWLANVPPPLRIYTARLIDEGDDMDGRSFYETEYCYLPTVSELFVYGSVGASTWSHVLRSCRQFLNACTSACGDMFSGPLLKKLVIDKTTDRLRRFADETGFNIDGMLRYGGRPLPSLMQIAEDISSRIDFGSDRRSHVMHGDFCFSNILYDSRVQRIHVIDPRGYITESQPSIMGDIRYDLAKLSHSITGRYDQIIAGRYHLDAPDSGRFEISFEQASHHAWLEAALDRFSIDGVGANGAEVRAITICLFLSMVPLHSDRPDRQRAFLANALRLYDAFENSPA